MILSPLLATVICVSLPKAFCPVGEVAVVKAKTNKQKTPTKTTTTTKKPPPTTKKAYSCKVMSLSLFKAKAALVAYSYNITQVTMDAYQI